MPIRSTRCFSSDAGRISRFLSQSCLWMTVFWGTATWADHWPRWRGPEGTGVCRETGVPWKWSKQENVLWTVEIPAWGNSTPVVWADRIFLTTHNDQNDLLLLCLNKTDGRTLWSRKVGNGEAPREAPRGSQKFHALNNLASPSPVTDGRFVAAHFGNGDLAVFDLEGNLQWKRNLQEDYGPYSIWWGHANSPVIVGDLLISICIQDSLTDIRETPSLSYVVAHDLRTGRPVWFTERMTGAEKEHGDAYTTPLVREADGRVEVIVMGAEQLDAYDAATGRQVWVLPGLVGNRVITGPTLQDDVVYSTIGMRGPVFAARIGGSGTLPRERIRWEYASNTPDSPSPVVCNGLLFIAADNGIAQCLDIENGAMCWRERLGREFKASPITAEGRVYFLDTSGRCTVVEAAREYRPVAVNDIPDRMLASPAVSDGKIFLRGRERLYCIGATSTP